MAVKCNTTLYNSNFNLNGAHEAGVIFAYSDTTINITKSQFSSNTAISGVGGVLSASELTHMTIIESIFYNNSAQRDGGIIFINNFCNLIIHQCQFCNNKAFKGGVVSARFQSNITILNSDFNNVTANETGGAMSIQEGAILHITNSSFRDCTAKFGGILVQNQNTLAIVNNCSFHRNFATVAGGVFFSQNSSQIALIGCDFVDNRATLGGVGMAQLQCNVIVIDSSVFNSVATHLGGAIYAITECLVYIKRCQFNGCKATSPEKYNDASGGALAIARLSKLVMKDSEIHNNTAQFGGGVAFTNQSYAYINNTQFSFNRALKGSGMDLSNQANVTVINCNFSENSGTVNSGAINLISESTLELKHTILRKNDGEFGGAICTNFNAIAIIADSTFIGNRGFAGGILFVFNSFRITLVNTLISESIALNYGSVIVVGTTVSFENNNCKKYRHSSCSSRCYIVSTRLLYF